MFISTASEARGSKAHQEEQGRDHQREEQLHQVPSQRGATNRISERQRIRRPAHQVPRKLPAVQPRRTRRKILLLHAPHQEPKRQSPEPALPNHGRLSRRVRHRHAPSNHQTNVSASRRPEAKSQDRDELHHQKHGEHARRVR